MLRSPPHDHRRSARWSCRSCRSGPNCGSATFLRTRWAAWIAHKTAAYCARHRFGADEAVLVRVLAQTDSRFRRKRRPMSFMNRPGRSIHFINRSIAPEMPRRVLLPDQISPRWRPRHRDARVAMPSLQLRQSLAEQPAARDRLLIQSFLRFFQPMPAWASPFGDGSTRAAAATLPEPTSGLRAFA
jgi:hypothetical protein